MAFCFNCGNELRNEAKFCDVCGTPVQEKKEEKNSRKTVFEGEIHKCPNCGEILNAFVNKCPSCGLELRGVASSSALKDFERRINSANDRDEKISIIRNFPIPNTKEDVLEFLILATSNVSHNMDSSLSSAWKTKTEQAYQKANLLFKNDKEFEHVQDQYNKFLGKINQDIKKEKAQKRGNVISGLMPVLPQFIIVFGWLLSIFILIPFAKTNHSFSLFLFVDFVVGAKFIPLALKCKSPLPKLVTALGLILSIVILVIICRTNNMRLYLLVDVICSAIIFFNMLKDNDTYEEFKYDFNVGSFYIALGSVGILFVAFVLGGIKAPKIAKRDNTAPTISLDQQTDDKKGIFSYEIRDYSGRNASSVGQMYGSDLVDEYGEAKVKIVFVSSDNILLHPNYEELKKDYIVVGQNIPVGTKINVVHQRDSDGDISKYLVDYQSYDEIILYVAPKASSEYSPTVTEIHPVLDKHSYYIRDYVGRNAASFGKMYGSDRVDEYGIAEVKLNYTEENGEYIDFTDENELKKYIVVSQDIKANSELSIVYDTDSDGSESYYLTFSQKYDEINLTVRKIDDNIIEKMPEIVEEDN